MINYEDFALEISVILPLPKNHEFASADGSTPVDLGKAAKSIKKAIKTYKKIHALTPAEVKKLKRIALERFDQYREAWNNEEAAN